jgi:hypothetical protein
VSAWALFVGWVDGDEHLHFALVAVTSSVEKARELAREYASTHPRVAAYRRDVAPLDPENFVIREAGEGWGDVDFVCSPIELDVLLPGWR